MVKYIPRPMGGPPRVVVGPAVLSTEHTPRGVEQLIFDKGKLLDANKSKVNVQFDEFPVLIPVRNYGLKAVVDAINEARLSTDFSREADAFVANIYPYLVGGGRDSVFPLHWGKKSTERIDTRIIEGVEEPFRLYRLPNVVTLEAPLTYSKLDRGIIELMGPEKTGFYAAGNPRLVTYDNSGAIYIGEEDRGDNFIAIPSTLEQYDFPVTLFNVISTDFIGNECSEL